MESLLYVYCICMIHMINILSILAVTHGMQYIHDIVIIVHNGITVLVSRCVSLQLNSKKNVPSYKNSTAQPW